MLVRACRAVTRRGVDRVIPLAMEVVSLQVGGAILSEVWTSQEAFQTFLENKLGPASAAAGVPGPTKVSVLPLIRHL